MQHDVGIRERVAHGLREARSTGALQLLVALIAPVPFLLVAHQLHQWLVPGFGSLRWNVNTDRSYIEIFGYLQTAATVALLLGRWLRQRAGAVYFGWALALGYVFLDDSLRVHEKGGGFLARHLTLPAVLGLQEKALGELLVWVLLGPLVLAVVVLTHWRSGPRARRESWGLAAGLGMLVFFAAFVDVGHSALGTVVHSERLNLLVAWFEAFGEIAAMSVLLAYTVHVVRRPRRPEHQRVPATGPASRSAPV